MKEGEGIEEGTMECGRLIFYGWDRKRWLIELTRRNTCSADVSDIKPCFVKHSNHRPMAVNYEYISVYSAHWLRGMLQNREPFSWNIGMSLNNDTNSERNQHYLHYTRTGIPTLPTLYAYRYTNVNTFSTTLWPYLSTCMTKTTRDYPTKLCKQVWLHVYLSKPTPVQFLTMIWQWIPWSVVAGSFYWVMRQPVYHVTRFYCCYLLISPYFHDSVCLIIHRK